MSGGSRLHVRVFVIGNASEFRSKTMASVLRQSPWPVSIAAPVVIDDQSGTELVDKEANSLLFGRRLTRGEIGCLLAHRTTYQMALQDRAEWALILEDDAELTGELWTRLQEVLDSVADQDPLIVSLFAQDYGRALVPSWRSLDGVIPLRDAPTNTVAYLINRPALRVATEAPSTVVSTADWPPWSTQVRFALDLKSGVQHGSDSMIGDRPAPASGVRSLQRLTRALSPRAWRLGRQYFPSARHQAQWTILAPGRKAFRRLRKNLA